MYFALLKIGANGIPHCVDLNIHEGIFQVEMDRYRFYPTCQLYNFHYNWTLSDYK
ncbi:MAG: hypothetical protein ACFFB5_04020 [Promethearchaeota archaeon]